MSPVQDRSVHAWVVRLAIVGLSVLGAAPAPAQTAIGFEAPDYNGSADGTVVTGQQGWYRPIVAGAVDQFIYTYDGNALGLPVNAFGEDQFLGAQAPRIGDFPRAQLDFDWSAASAWTTSYDLAVRWNGMLPAVDNISSFSLQDSLVARYFIAVNTWANPNVATLWNANYFVFDASGVLVDPPGLSPGPAWRNLAVDHWYRQSTTFDFDSNSVLSVSITDLDTGQTASFEPTGWYLAGGATGRPPLPTALRFFVGGVDDLGAPGNAAGFDNLLIEAGAGASAPDRGDSQGVQRIPPKPGPATN